MVENAINYAKDNNCEVVELTSYKDTIEYVKSLTGELSVDTYQKVKEIIDSLSLF